MLSHPSFHPYLRFTWKHSAFYRKLYLAQGIRESDLDEVTLQDLPIVSKQMVQDNFDEVVTDPRIGIAAVNEWLEHDRDPRSRFLGEFLVMQSSGSSGKLTNFVYDENAWRSMTTAAAPYLYPGTLPAGMRYRNAFYIGERGHIASATTAMNSSQAAFERLIVSMEDPIEETIAQLNDFQPDRLTSYSSSLGWLAELALERKLNISPRDVVISADRMTPPVEAKIRQAWAPNFYDLYAATESLFMAIKQPQQAEWKVLDELQTIEVLGADNCQVQTGAIGRTVLTNWSNRTLPLIRYDLTDYVICGETQPGHCTLRGFVGRSFENLPIRLEDGRTGQIPSYVLANFQLAGLDEFEFVTHSPDLVEVQYCACEDQDEVMQIAIADLLAKNGGARTKFNIRRVDHIWNDAISLKQRLVRGPDAPQVRLPQYILSVGSPNTPGEQLRPGGGFVPFAREWLEDSLAVAFDRQAARTPEAIALIDGPLRLTYAELNRAANRIAHTLRAQKMDPAYPVALLFNHQAEMIMAMIGVIKSGGWYAPLDPSHPVVRNSAILGEIGSEFALTDSRGLTSARSYGFTDEQIICMDDLDEGVDSSNLDLHISPDAPACILYTSGSTGQPKGVVLDQRAVLHRTMLYTNDYAIGPADRLALLQSYVFNAAVREIYAALLNGASLHLYSLKRDGVHHLSAWLEEEGITMLYMVPAVFRVFLDTLKGERFEQLRVIRLGGENVLARDVEGFQRHFGMSCVLANGLASTETGTICQYFINHATRIVGNRVPSGWAVLDKDLSLMDEKGCPVVDGMTGEIVVTSAYLGPGYFSRGGALAVPGPGEKRVVPTGDLGYRLTDGRIMLVGRKDWQVKLRGQRMNLVEIEQAVLMLENVADAAVILQTAPDGTDFLAAYIQPITQPAPSEEHLRQGLRSRLPEAMIPAAFLFFERLPRTMSGKIDRQALPLAERGPGASRSTIELLPQTPTEKALAEIWHELLGVEPVGAEDRFFDLGGDSLQASALMARIEDRFKLKLPLSMLFQQETLRDLAGCIDAQGGGESLGLLVTIQPLGEKPPIFFIPGMGGDVLFLRDLVENLGNERPLYGVKSADFGDSALNMKTIEQVAEQYADAIRAFQKQGPYILLGYSFGGHLAIETARWLAVQGSQENLVVLIDTYPAVSDHPPVWVERAMFHLFNLRKLKSVREVAGYFRDWFRRIYLRLIGFKKTPPIVQQPGMSEPSANAIAKIALAAYRPRPYPGRAVLFQASQTDEWEYQDPMKAWKKVIPGRLEIRTLPGEHLNLVKNPQAIELARQLREVVG